MRATMDMLALLLASLLQVGPSPSSSLPSLSPPLPSRLPLPAADTGSRQPS